jgi:hypothetical protein
VLIAVLVLALGLLGLAAVFPAVIAQQRDAVDRTQGAVVAKIVEQTLDSGQYLVDFNGLRRDFWFSAEAQIACGEGFDLDPENMSFLWEPTWRWGPSGHMILTRGDEYADTGSISVGRGKILTLGCSTRAPMPAEQYYVPVTARLYPQPYTGGDPKYVWDFVARRARLAGEATGLELAVFIRRVDPGIRVPRGKTLSDVLSGNGVTANEYRLPVAVDANTGRPTGDGIGAYSMPIALPAVVGGGALDEIVLDAAANSPEGEMWRSFVASPGQILVDNLGNVVNVVRVPEPRAGDPLSVVVDHRYASGEADFAGGTRGVKVEQVLFTPQKPVRVFTYRAQW